MSDHNLQKIKDMLARVEKKRLAIQQGIHQALLIHKKLGYPVSESRNNQVVWVQPEDILIDEKNDIQDEKKN